MGCWEYLKEVWYELWSPDSSGWQIVDRILFPVLPLLSFAIWLSKSNLPQGWQGVMSNLLWQIPLGVWLLYFLLIVPFRLVKKYKQKWKDTEAILDSSRSIKPPHNRDTLIRAMERVKQAALSCYGLRQFDRLISRVKDKTLTHEDIWHATNDSTEELLNSIQNLDTELAIARLKDSLHFDDFRTTAILPGLLLGLFSLSTEIKAEDWGKLRESLDIDDYLDESMTRAIDSMDSKLQEGHMYWVSEKYGKAVEKIMKQIKYDRGLPAEEVSNDEKGNDQT